VTRFLPIAKVGDVERGAVKAIERPDAGVDCVLYRDGDTYYAAQRRCPHAGFDLAEGFVSRGYLVCPLHSWRFACDTGIHELSPGTCLAMHTLRIEGDTIEIDPTPHRNCTPFDPFAGDDP
jgi:nitrite reductase/ring-hydroxylating ferredoxin subunit